MFILAADERDHLLDGAPAADREQALGGALVQRRVGILEGVEQRALALGDAEPAQRGQRLGAHRRHRIGGQLADHRRRHCAA